MALKSNAKFEEKIWCARFVQSMHFLTLKFREELDVMVLKSGAKSDEKLTFGFKMVLGFGEFHWSSWFSTIVKLNIFVQVKVRIASAKNLQRSLTAAKSDAKVEINWLVVSKVM